MIFVLFYLFLICLADAEWTPNSLIQPGPCPTTHTQSLWDLQRFKGQWQIVQMPQTFPVCCRSPVLDIPDTSTQPLTGNHSSLSSPWKATLDWSSCSEDLLTMDKKWTMSLWPNPMLPGSFAVKLPWPLNLVGFTTLNVLNTDSFSYSAAFVCHSLLMEHVLVPVILKREAAELNTSELHRLKWNLIRGGVLSAWDLVDSVREECNSLATPSFSTTPSPPPSSSTTADAFSQNDTINFPTDPQVTLTKTSESSEDPDSEVEWITTESNLLKPGDDPINFPDEFPYPVPVPGLPVPPAPLDPWFPALPRPPFDPPRPPGPDFGGLWPPFFFGKDHQTPRINHTSPREGFEASEVSLMPLPPDPVNGKMAHLVQNKTD